MRRLTRSFSLLTPTLLLVLMAASCDPAALMSKLTNPRARARSGAGAGNGSPLSQDEMAKGLREALTIGIGKGSDLAGTLDAYFANEAIKILLPPAAKQMASRLRAIGLGAQVDRAIRALNRAAETAAKEAKAIFMLAIKSMKIQDVLNILTGADNAATMYLKRVTWEHLRAKFEPVIRRCLDTVHATKYWAQIMGAYNKIPFVTRVETDLPKYVTKKALDGLFHLLAAQEKRIRKNPLARVTALLKRVFGWVQKQLGGGAAVWPASRLRSLPSGIT